MGRIVLGLLCGLVVAGISIFIVEALGHAIYPPPADIDIHNPEAWRAIMASMPLMAFVLVLVAWLLGALAGAWVAVRMVARPTVWPGIAIGVVILAGIGYNLVILPHPVWMLPAALVLVPLSAWLGASLGLRRSAPPPV